MSTLGRRLTWRTSPSSSDRALLEPRLPPELFYPIIDYLQESPPDLKVCALVARSWRTRCQTYLFRLVKFDVWSLPPANLPFVKRRFVWRLEGLTSQSRLVQFTQELHIEAANIRVGNRITAQSMYRILTYIPSFNNLHTLILNVPWNLDWGLPSKWPVKELGSSISRTIRQNPDLKTISLRNPLFTTLDDLLAILGFYSLNLEQLTIGNMETLPNEIRSMTSDEVRLWMREKLAHCQPRLPLTGIFVGYLHSRIRDEILLYPGLINWKAIKYLNMSWDRRGDASSSCSSLLHHCLHDKLVTLELTFVNCTDMRELRDFFFLFERD